MWPSKDGGAFQSGPDSKLILPSGKEARIIYSLMGGGRPVIKLKFQLNVNYIFKVIMI